MVWVFGGSKDAQFGHAGVNNQNFGGGGMSMEDIFSQFGEICGGDSPFESFFGGRSSGRQRVYKGSDLRIKIEISLEEDDHHKIIQETIKEYGQT